MLHQLFIKDLSTFIDMKFQAKYESSSKCLAQRFSPRFSLSSEDVTYYDMVPQYY